MSSHIENPNSQALSYHYHRNPGWELSGPDTLETGTPVTEILTIATDTVDFTKKLITKYAHTNIACQRWRAARS